MLISSKNKQDYTEMLCCKFTQCLYGHTAVGHSLYLYVTGPTKIDHLSTKNCQFLACLLYHTLITIYTTATKIYITTADFIGLSSAAYGNGIVHSKQKILAKI